MARPMKPLVRGGGYYPSNGWTPLVYPGGYTTANGGEEPAPQPIEKTVTGNPIHILDALAKPAQALSVKLEPIQDLNGYDNPWPGGGGKNKLPNTAQSATVNDVQYIVNAVDGSITANGTSNGWTGLTIGQCTLPAGTWYLDSGVTTGYADYYLEAQIGGVNYSTNVAGGRRQFVLSAETSVSVKLYVRSGATVTNAICYPMISADVAGTGYAPYSNICPISGWTGAKVTRTGKNLCYKVLPYAGTLVGDGNKYLRILNAPGTSACFKCVEGETYIVSGATGRNRGLVAYFDSDPELDSQSVYPNTTAVTAFADGFSFTAEHTAYALCYLANTTLSDVNIQIELGSTATAYEPYNGNEYTIQLGETVYGGTVDVVNGKMVVDRAMVDLGTLAWRYNTAWAPAPRFYSSTLRDETIHYPGGQYPDGTLCSSYIVSKSVTVSAVGNDKTIAIGGDGYIYIQDVSYDGTTLNDFKAALSGVQFVYMLATPYELTLTPTEVTLLLGENNLFSDGEMTLVYLADGNASDEEALNILLGGRYVNNHTEDEPTDREALNIILGGNER